MSLFSLFKSELYRAEEKSLLYIAIENENLEAVKILLKNEDIEINDENNIYRENGDSFDCTPTKYDRYQNFLIKNYRKTALHIAVQKNLVDYVELLLSNPKIDVNFPYIIFEEIWRSTSTREADFYEVDICDVDNNGKDLSQTALHIAVDNGNVEIVKLLLSNPEIDVNILSKSSKVSQTALHIAVYNGNVEIVKLLLSNPEIDVNIPTTKTDYSYRNAKESKTELHIAVYNKNVEIVKLLLSNPKIDVNISTTTTDYSYSNTNESKTALHIAYQIKNQEIIDLLLKRNDINVDALDNYNKKPSDYANNNK